MTTTETTKDNSGEFNKSDFIQVIVFSVGQEEYGLEIEKVQEVIRLKSIKKLPRSPDFILGVMNLRGKIIPIVGLREKFNLEKIEYNEFTRIIVVNQNNKFVGMVVDEVNRVVNVPAENVEGNPDMVTDKTRSLVRGVAKLKDSVVILVELDYLLYTLEEIQYEE